MKARKYICKAILYIVMTLIAVLMIYPLFSMVCMSFFTEEEISMVPRPFFAQAMQWKNYAEAFSVAGTWTDDFETVSVPYMLLYIKNSFLVLILYLLGTVLSATLCAYAFAKVNFAFKNVIFMVILATMMIPSAVTMIPMFIVYKFFGMLDSLLPLWVPVWFGGGAVNIFLLRQFMRGIPNDLLESAEIDGAGHFRRMLQIVMPNCVPIILYIILTSTMGVWNDFFTPLLYVTEKSQWTLALGIANIVQTNDAGLVSKQNLLMAACVIMTLFPLVLFGLGQRYFIESVTMTGLKG